MFMLPRKVYHLGDFCFRYFISKHATYTDAALVNMQLVSWDGDSG